MKKLLLITLLGLFLLSCKKEETIQPEPNTDCIDKYNYDIQNNYNDLMLKLISKQKYQSNIDSFQIVYKNCINQ